jgi:hypothetical protein
VVTSVGLEGVLFEESTRISSQILVLSNIMITQYIHGILRETTSEPVVAAAICPYTSRLHQNLYLHGLFITLRLHQSLVLSSGHLGDDRVLTVSRYGPDRSESTRETERLGMSIAW